MPDPPSHPTQKRSVDTTRLVRRHQPVDEKNAKKDTPPPQEQQKEGSPSKHSQDQHDQPESELSEDANREADLERLQREVKIAQKYIYYSQVYTGNVVISGNPPYCIYLTKSYLDDHYAYR